MRRESRDAVLWSRKSRPIVHVLYVDSTCNIMFFFLRVEGFGVIKFNGEKHPLNK